MLGPIDYIEVAFNGNNFDGSILEALAEATDSGAIRVVDMVFVIKDSDGNLSMAELEDQDEDLKQVAKMIGHKGDMPLLTEDDIQKLGNAMNNDSSAGILIIEQLWAKGLKKALIDAGAELLDEGRIHPEKASAAFEEVKHTKSSNN
jgi:hypothetical protein